MASAKDTYEESLRALLVELAKMKLLADVNLPFVLNLETQILSEFNSPQRVLQSSGAIPPGGANPMGADALGLPPGAGGGIAAPPPSFAGAGVPGPMQTAPSSNPDELRRILTAGG